MWGRGTGSGPQPRYAKPRPSPWSQPVQWLLKEPVRVGYLLAALALALSWPFGGWRSAAPEALPVGEPGTVLSAAPYELSVERVFHSERPGSGFLEMEDGSYVVLLGTLRSTHTEPTSISIMREAIQVDDLPRQLDGIGRPVSQVFAGRPEIYSAEDQTPMTSIGPDLEHPVAWVWRTGARELPDTLHFTIHAHTWRESSLEFDMQWLDPAPAATVELPLTYQEPWRPEEGDQR